MKLILEVEVPAGDAAEELSHIFRYWSSNLHHYQFVSGNSSPIYDSSNNEVGRWHVVGGHAADGVEDAFDDFEAYAARAADDDTEDDDDTGDGTPTGDGEGDPEYDAAGEYARSDEA